MITIYYSPQITNLTQFKLLSTYWLPENSIITIDWQPNTILATTNKAYLIQIQALIKEGKISPDNILYVTVNKNNLIAHTFNNTGGIANFFNMTDLKEQNNFYMCDICFTLYDTMDNSIDCCINKE